MAGGMTPRPHSPLLFGPLDRGRIQPPAGGLFFCFLNPVNFVNFRA